MARTLRVKGEPVPEPEPDEMSHDELERELIDAGIIAGHPDDDAIRKDAREHMLRVLGHRRDDEERDTTKAGRSQTKEAGAVQIATFTC